MGVGNALIGDLERRLVNRTLERQALFRMIGSDSHAWKAEQELEAMYPGYRCLLLPSATVGLSLLLESLDLPKGGEVLISPFGWLSNWSCIRRAGLVPRFLPLDEGLQLRAGAVEARMGSDTAAVIVTHLMGRGQQEVEAIARVCEARGVPLLEDVAQSFGVSVGGRRAGTFGAGAWCSLNHHKVLSTGDGGFVLIRDPELYERVGGRHDQGCVLRGGKRRPAERLEPGLSLRVSEVVAAVLRAQLARFNFIRTRVGRLHEALSNACRDERGLELIPPHEGDLPFTVLFRRDPDRSHPSLAASGWHVAPNVPWLEAVFRTAMEADGELEQTFRNLDAVGAIGSGFIDPFYSIPFGLAIGDGPERVPEVLNELESTT